MKLLSKGRYGVVANVAGISDPCWWIKDDTGFKVTYLISAHVHTAPRWPAVRALHLIAGPFRLVLCWQKVKRSWVGPMYAFFALSVFSFQDFLMEGRFWLAALWLALMLSYAKHIAKGAVRP